MSECLLRNAKISLLIPQYDELAPNPNDIIAFETAQRTCFQQAQNILGVAFVIDTVSTFGTDCSCRLGGKSNSQCVIRTTLIYVDSVHGIFNFR